MAGDLQEPRVELANGEAVAPDARAADLHALRERLKARGVLTDAPAVVIPREPRPASTGDGEEAHPADPAEEPHWADSPYDAWDVEPGPETTDVACPGCRTTCTVPVESTRVPCASCDRTWRHVVCDQCGHLGLAFERQESWRCHRCGHFSRSWWRTPSARLLALRVLAERRDALVQEQRRVVREGMRMRRWKLIAFGMCAALAAAVIVVATRAAEPDVASGRQVACSHFRAILEDVAAGRTTPAGLGAELEQLELEATGEPDLSAAIAGLRAARGPTTPEFITARATLVDACGAEFGRSR